MATFSNAGGITTGKARPKNDLSRYTSASSEVHSIIVFAIHLLNVSSSMASAISCFPSLSKGPETRQRDMAPSSLLAPQRALCSGRGVGGINNADGGEGAREACKNRKICSGLKWAFGG